MPWYVWVGIGVLLVAGVVVAQVLGWIELRGVDRGRGSGAGALGFVDEVFHPTKHEAQQELVQQTELPAPAPAPGDGPLDLEDGRVRIDLRRET
ncbi:hypothetical protein [Homoserinibacter sp. GY 40078]|uniref:hypothetical protein n=1 Tax=Homoserinibacter sp. GY 40078 TaxID=2603275 RepID=UPI0011C8C00C|nr:hypothetical protein [Homoserinibacter sp. GY 40078]TXK19028.1 hypothetical protein FVQ89_03615 [Homoserinibacter sp. GY 40078]